jgi:hypothetical protein
VTALTRRYEVEETTLGYVARYRSYFERKPLWYFHPENGWEDYRFVYPTEQDARRAVETWGYAPWPNSRRLTYVIRRVVKRRIRHER